MCIRDSDKTAFVPAKVKAYCKNANIFGYNDELTVKIKRANTLIEKEKKLKKEVKEKTLSLIHIYFTEVICHYTNFCIVIQLCYNDAKIE